MVAIVTSTDTRRSAVAPTVQLKSSWIDEWETIEGLHCNWLALGAGPVVASAGFVWDYGYGMRQGDTGYGTVSPLDPLDGRRWVRVEVPQHGDEDPLVWIGWITEAARQVEGARLDGDGARIPGGSEDLVAYGPLILLDQDKITTSYYRQETGESAMVPRGLAFNRKNHSADNGNRSDVEGADGKYLFTHDPAAGQPWSTRTICEYLLFYHATADPFDGRTIPFEVHPDALEYLPTWDAPRLPTESRTPKQILDALLGRRRLLGYTIEVFEAAIDRVRIRPFTFADVDVDVPGSEATVPANASQKSLDFDRAINIERAVVKKSAVQTYDQVVVRGAEVLCCGTISAVEETIAAGWSDDLEADYETAASTSDGYADLSTDEKEARNTAYRQSDKFARVFSYFSLPADWDGLVGDGEDEEDPADLFPFEDLDVDADETTVWYLPELRFEASLPLKTDHDYSGTRITPGEGEDGIGDNTPTGESWEYVRPLVFLKLLDAPPAADGDEAYGQVDMLAVGSIEGTGDGGGRDWACEVRVQEDAPGLVLRVTGSAPQHAIAYGGFTPCGDEDDYPAGELDWEDNLVATIAMRADYRCEARHPADVPPALDMVRRLWIEAGDRYQVHYVAPHTVVDVDDQGQLVRTDTGGFVRDDRDYLMDLARVAYEWYGVERQALALQWLGADIAGRFAVGDLVTTIGADETEEDIRTVITQVRIDFAESDDQTHQTSIQTQWAELDVLQL